MPERSRTKRLHYDPKILSFRATVTGHERWEGRPAVVLDRTAFYPEAGGQMADHGALGPLDVVDVQVDDEGVVHHVVDGTLPALGTELEGKIDERRRRLHMAEHTGQHMLSRALLDVAGAKTISSRLGERACTLDVGRKSLSPEELRRAEEQVNDVIEADEVVRATFPSPEELATLPLRRRIKVADNVRVVAVGSYDLVPCGGTHCTRTSEVGLLTIVGAERYKGMTRITFAAGRKARQTLKEHFDVLADLGRRLTCSPLDVPKAVDNVRGELEDVRGALHRAEGHLAEHAAQRLLSASEGPLVAATFEGESPAFLRALGARIAAEPGRVALLAATTPEGLQIFAARGAESDFDCGAFVRAVTTATGGRGGGRPEHAEGRLPATASWSSLVSEHAGTRPD